jgi:uncharacterized protein YwqG
VTPTSYEQLRGVLLAHGLSPQLTEHAAWGIAVLPGGSGRSKLGGLPEIAGSWPLNDGRALTHLASIVLEELPDVPVRSQLPSTGTLVFFADFSTENEGWGRSDGAEAAIAVMHVPAGGEMPPAVAPDEAGEEYNVPVVLNERRVRFEPVLTMPVLDEIFDQLDNDGDPTALDAFAVELDAPEHLLLGEPTYIQEDPREPGDLSLLQLNWDEALGFTYGDGGQISFYGRPEDLRAGLWQHVRAMPDSA